MVHETIDGTYQQTNLQNEPANYLSKREELRLAEIELMRQRERVAELRRRLPKGAIVQDYEFEEGPTDLNAGDKPTRTVRLSELFTGENRSLVLYHFMYRKAEYQPLPDVHLVDRRRQWCRSPPGPEHRLCHRCRGRSDSSASTRTYKRVGQSAAFELRRQYVQVRFRQ